MLVRECSICPCKQAALKQLPRNKVPHMAVMIKSLTRSTMDASVVFKDPTGKQLGSE